MKKFILLITLSRILFAPLIFISIIFELYLLGLMLMLLSGITDFLDGFQQEEIILLRSRKDIGSYC